jgi:hypothetical protein
LEIITKLLKPQIWKEVDFFVRCKFGKNWPKNCWVSLNSWNSRCCVEALQYTWRKLVAFTPVVLHGSFSCKSSS